MKQRVKTTDVHMETVVDSLPGKTFKLDGRGRPNQRDGERWNKEKGLNAKKRESFVDQ